MYTIHDVAEIVRYHYGDNAVEVIYDENYDGELEPIQYRFAVNVDYKFSTNGGIAGFVLDDGKKRMAFPDHDWEYHYGGKDVVTGENWYYARCKICGETTSSYTDHGSPEYPESPCIA